MNKSYSILCRINTPHYRDFVLHGKSVYSTPGLTLLRYYRLMHVFLHYSMRNYAPDTVVLVLNANRERFKIMGPER